MQKDNAKVEKISIFSSLDVKLEFLTSWVELTQFSVESSRVKLKIWATQLKLSWKCEQFNSILIRVQNVNLKLNLMINLQLQHYSDCHLQIVERKTLYFLHHWWWRYHSRKDSWNVASMSISNLQFIKLHCIWLRFSVHLHSLKVSL